MLFWLGSQRKDVQRELIEYDPELAIETELIDEELKKELIDQIIKTSSEGKLLDENWSLYWKYDQLKHPLISEQLKDYLKNDSITDEGKIEIIRIAEACDVKGLGINLSRIALSSNETIELRKYAVRAIGKIGSKKAKMDMLELIDFDSGDDLEQRIKGFALSVVWPEYIDVKTFLQNVSPPKRRISTTAYTYLFGEEFGKYLDISGLCTALEWVIDNQALFGDRDNLISSIYKKGWQHLDNQKVLKLYCKAAAKKIKRHDLELWGRNNDDFFIALKNDDVKRKLLIKGLIEENIDEFYSHWLLRGDKEYLKKDDFKWVLNEFKTSNKKENWLKLLFMLFDVNQVTHVNLILQHSKNKLISERFKWYLGSVDLFSEEAEKEKNKFKESLKWGAPKEQTKLLKPSPKEIVLELLDKFNEGDLDAWWRLNLEMQLEED